MNMPLYTDVPRLVSLRRSRLRNRWANSSIIEGSAVSSSNHAFTSALEATDGLYHLCLLQQRSSRLQLFASSQAMLAYKTAEPRGAV